MKYWKLILIAILLVAVALGVEVIRRQRSEIKRLATNQEQITQLYTRELELKKSEYNQLNIAWKDKLNEVLKANEIKLRTVQSATVIQTVFKDTGSTKIIYKDIVQLPDRSFKIPLSVDDDCWGLKGFINSMDQNSQLEITERTSLNSVQLIVVRKRFLGFLWMTKRTEFKAFSDCGEVDVTKIDFKK